MAEPQAEAPTPEAGPARRFLMLPLVRIILGVIWVATPIYLGQWYVVYLVDGYFTAVEGPAYLATGFLFAGLSIGLYAVFVRVVERRAPVEVALEGAASELGAGVALGLAMITTIVGVLWLLGCYRVTGVNDGQSIAYVFTLVGMGIVIEEVVARGLVLRIVEERFGTMAALVVSSALFGVVHHANPGATVFSSTAVAVEGGLMLGAAYVLTRRLWLAVGLHVAWNFAQAGIFGTPVSGFAFSGLLRGRLEGPEWLTGGAFGLETSVLSFVLALLVCAAMMTVAAQRGTIKRRLPTRRSRRGNESEDRQ